MRAQIKAELGLALLDGGGADRVRREEGAALLRAALALDPGLAKARAGLARLTEEEGGAGERGASRALGRVARSSESFAR